MYILTKFQGAKSLLRRLNYVIFKMLRSLNTPQWAPYALEVPKMQIKYGYFGCLYETLVICFLLECLQSHCERYELV